MEILIRSTAQDVARTAADIVERAVRTAGTDGLTLGLATGGSPEGMYAELIRRHREEGLSFAHARAFLLDEYRGLSADHPQSYHATIRRTLTASIDIPDDAVRSPRGDADDAAAEAARYDASIREAGGVDLQVLGVGRNGHIAFNEPAGSLASRTREVRLTPSTIEANSRYFDSAEEVPTRAMSQGIGTIMEARRIVLVAQGEDKAEAIAQAVEGPIAALWPVTILQMHPDATLVVDEAAASQLRRRDHYRAADPETATS